MKINSLYLSSKSQLHNCTCKDFVDVLEKNFKKVAVFKPIEDAKTNLHVGISLQESKELLAKGQTTILFKKIIEKFKALQAQNDFVLCLGVDLDALSLDYNINLEIAKNLGVVYANILENTSNAIEDVNIESFSIKESGCTHFASFVLGADISKFENLHVEVLSTYEDAIALLDKHYPTPTTPSMFEFELFQRAKSDKKTIVLPESEDDRVLKAASELLRQDVVNLILLGDESEVSKRADELNLNLTKAQIINPENSPLCEGFAQTFYELRKAKGISLEDAQKTIKSPNYFATMMVYEKKADGMVSGAVGTTADTIRPALQIIKTKPGVSIVSSVFFMCLDKDVYVFGDCAVNPEPNADHLAQIATTSAQTASLFGIDPKVAMLSYSTGSSGQGASVEKVKEALELAKKADPKLKIDGPIQFDAAIDKSVASKKMPQSKVAGNANTFIFPDLNAGNIGYKAVQRTANAIAIGPVLQGLKKPINDLSRGCLIEDIINTVAITAIQAQGE